MYCKVIELLIFFRVLSIIGYYKILNIFMLYNKQVFVAYLFIYSNVFYIEYVYIIPKLLILHISKIPNNKKQ